MGIGINRTKHVAEDAIKMDEVMIHDLWTAQHLEIKALSM